MNILVVCHYGLYEDLSFSFVHQQASAYAALGHRVRVVIPTPVGKQRADRRMGPPLVFETVDGVELCYLRFLSLSQWGARVGFNLQSCLAALRLCRGKLLADFHPDVIHAHTLGFDSEIGAWLKKSLNCPLVVTTHGIDTFGPFQEENYDALQRWTNQPDALIAVSSLLRSTLQNAGVKREIQTILNGFRVQFAEAKQKEQFSFIQVGYLIPRKKTDVTLRSFAKVHQAHPQARLAIIGEGAERPALEKLSRELGVADAVRFTGLLPNPEVLAEMAKAQFFVMPSVREGFGIVYLEAMASGCVTIGTEGEGIADLIVSSENGFLVAPDDPDAIVAVVEQCLNHPEQADAVVKQGGTDARNLTWQHNAEQYVALFQSLTERN